MNRSKIADSKNSSLNKAFENINSAVGSELNEIVNIIEENGRKKTATANTGAQVIPLNKVKKKSRFAFAR